MANKNQKVLSMALAALMAAGTITSAAPVANAAAKKPSAAAVKAATANYNAGVNKIAFAESYFAKYNMTSDSNVKYVQKYVDLAKTYLVKLPAGAQKNALSARINKMVSQLAVQRNINTKFAQGLKYVNTGLGFDLTVEGNVDTAAKYLATANTYLNLLPEGQAKDILAQKIAKLDVNIATAKAGQDDAAKYAELKAAAETAVAAYEKADLTTLDNANKAADLKKAATDAVAKLKAEDQTAFNTRIAAQDAKVADAIAKLSVLKVDSVSAINSRQIKIVFTKAVNEDTITSDNVKVYFGTSTTVTTWTSNLSEDGKTLVLGLNSAIPQDSDVKVTLNDVESKDNAKETITEYTTTKHMVDTVAPVVNGVVGTTSKTFKIVSSEPLELESGASSFHVFTNITVDGNKLVGKLTQDYSKNEVAVELGSSLAVGSHKVVVEGYKDAAGFTAAKYEGTITVVEDKAAPKVVKVDAVSRTKVTITFDEPVATLGTITIKGATWTVANPATDISADKTQYTVTAPAGTALDLASTVEEKLSYTGTTDMEGNAVTTDDKASFTFKIADDATLPTAAISLDKDNNVVIVFSKEMSDPGKITIKDKDGKVTKRDLVPVLDSTDTTNKTYKVSATSAGLDTNATVANYSITLSGAKDNGVRTNTIADTTTTVSAADKVAPAILNAVLSQAQTYKADGVTVDKYAQVTVYFTEPMDPSTIGNLSNYTVKVVGTAATAVPLSTVTNASATVASDAKSVVLTIPGATAAGVATDTKVYALGLKDAVGNLIEASSISVNYGLNEELTVVAPAGLTPIDLVDADSTLSATQYAVMNATNKLVVKFNNKMSYVDPSEFTLVKADGSVALVGISSSLNTDQQTATITLSGNLNADGTYGTAKNAVRLVIKQHTTSVDTNTKDIYGNYFVQTYNTYANGKTLTDEVAPTLTKVEKGTNPNSIKLTFSEVVTEGTAADLVRSIVLKDADGNVLPQLTAGNTQGADDLTGAGATDTITLAIDPAYFANFDEGDNTVKFSIPVSRTVTDKSNNVLAPIAEQNVTVNVDLTAPTATLGADSTTTNLKLTLSEDATIAVVSAGTTWTGATAGTTAITSTTPVTDGQKVQFTLTDPAGNVKSYTATYTAATTSWAVVAD